MSERIIILTAADSSYFARVQATLWTVARFAPRAKVILLDLGMTREQSDYLGNTPPFYLKDFAIQKFDFSKYPAHFSMAQNAGRAGFRPVSVQLAARQYGGVVIWIDAKCIMTCNPSGIIGYAMNSGIYCRAVYGTIGQTVFPSAQSALGVTPEIAKLPMRQMGACVFDVSNPAVMALVDQWVTVTLDAKCAAPEGSKKSNHFQGGIFAALLAKSGMTEPGKPIGCVEKLNLPLAEAKFRLRHLCTASF